MQLRVFNACETFMLVQVQDDGPDSFAPDRSEDLEVRTDPQFFLKQKAPSRIETEGTVTIMSRADGKQLFQASYPDTRAAAIFIESGETGELNLEQVKLVRSPLEMTLTIDPLSSSVARPTRMDPLKALFLASALRMCANHSRLLPKRYR